MGIFSKIFGIFKRKKKEIPLEPLPTPLPKPEVTSESTTVENIKARMDLVLTQLDSLRVQYEAMNARIMQIEKMTKEMYDMAKSS